MARFRGSIAYFVSAVVCGAAALFLYPFFFSQSYRGFDDNPPSIVIFVKGSLGLSNPTADVVVENKEGMTHLVVSQADVTEPSQEGAAVYIGIQRQLDGFSFEYSPLDCSATGAGDETPATTVASIVTDSLWAEALTENLVGGTPTVTGEATSISFDAPTTAPSISCDLESFGFGRESIATWNLYLPGVESYALARSRPVITSYSVGREPSEFLQQASQQPSETLATQYSWYERDYESLARQGLFLEVTSPQLQQASAYRLFVAGAVLGLGGGFLVAAVQTLIEAFRPTP